MASNLSSALFLTISSLAFVCFGEQSNNGGSGTSLSCVQKLLPCHDSLVSHSTSPPPTCCIPMKQTIQDDPQCLCNVLSNPEILKGLNITRQDALNLAKYCKATVDLSICETAGGPSPSLPPAPSNSSSSTSSSSASVCLEASFGVPVAISFVLFLLSIGGLI